MTYKQHPQYKTKSPRIQAKTDAMILECPEEGANRASLIEKVKEAGFDFLIEIGAWEIRDEKVYRATPKPDAETKPKEAPKPRTLYREPKDQAEHKRAVRALLKGQMYPRAVALEAHDQIGMTYAEKRQKVPFGQITRELTPKYLAPFIGCGLTKVKEGMAAAVAAGLYVRVDNGQGGKHNSNGSTYKAVVPAHWS